ncbi:MAG TPA: glycoside hydrolase family 2 TIM barrel-domain containing protein, partial [Chloroflexota bacterium]
QDKFDVITLDMANAHGLGVVMPLNLPPDGDYANADFVNSLLDQARLKVALFKNHPALRMWGVGNEVFWEMDPSMYPAFQQAYLKIVDLFHQLDPNHPVIYREAEDRYVPEFTQMLQDSGNMRPWLLYGMNIYDKDTRAILASWPNWGLDRPTLVSEFGAQGATPQQRAQGYLEMWRGIRAFPSFVLGGAPYVWTTEGPEPTDKTLWGLMDGSSRPVDDTFALLSHAWRQVSTSH